MPSLKRNVLWTTAGSTVLAASQWALVLIIARSAGAEALGAFVFALAVVTPLFLLTDLKLANVLVTDAVGRFRFEHYLATRVVGILVSVALVLAIVLFVEDDAAIARVYLVVLALKSVEGVLEIFLARLQRHERLATVARARMLLGAATLAFALLAAWLDGAAPTILLAAVGASLLVLVAYVLPRAARLPGAPRAAQPIGTAAAMAAIARRAWPLGLAMLVASAFDYVPRYVIEHRFSLEVLGHFAAIGSLVLAGNVVLAALSQAATPRLANLHADGDEAAFVSVLKTIVALGVALGGVGVVLAIAIGEPVVALLFGADFAAYAWLLIWFSLVFMARASFTFFAAALEAMQVFDVQYKILLASVVVLLAAMLPGAVTHGLAGVCAALLLATLFEGICYAWAVRRYLPSRRVKPVAGDAPLPEPVARRSGW